MMRETKGITLVSLIITIIVLLILAGASIATITGYDSIPDNAKVAVDSARQDTTVEQNMVNAIDSLFKKYSGLIPLKGVAKVDTNGLAVQDTLIRPEGNTNLQIVIPKGFAPAILVGSNSTTSLPGQDGKVKSIMQAAQWENITVEQINKGIVIVDNSITYDGGATTGTVPDFNEYVWVPIQDSSNFVREEWSVACGYNENGVWVNGEGVTHRLANEAEEYAFWENIVSREYIDMVASVKTNKGFYVSRYEACGSEDIALSKRGQNVKNNINQNQAITYSNNNSINNTHLIYGIEWDSILNWLIGNAIIESSTEGQNKTMELSDVQTNSASWGNYSNATGNANTNAGGNAPQRTGTNEYWKANNIYDLAGNVNEWTQETYSVGNDKVSRGGDYYDLGEKDTAAFRAGDANTSNMLHRRFPL